MRLAVGNPTLAAAIVAADVLSVASADGKQGVQFVAERCEPWTSSSADDLAAMFWSFSRVIRALERGGHTLISICLEQLAVIDGCVLIPIGGQISPIVGGKVSVYAPPTPTLKELLSPELAAVRRLPAEVDYRGVYYSLAALLSTQGMPLGKLGHALKRCLDVNPEERSLAVV